MADLTQEKADELNRKINDLAIDLNNLLLEKKPTIGVGIFACMQTAIVQALECNMPIDVLKGHFEMTLQAVQNARRERLQ